MPTLVLSHRYSQDSTNLWRERAFFKPVDEKWFPARVYERGAAIEADAGMDPGLPGLAAQPVTWEVEFRAFVVERSVAALSPYIRAGAVAQAEDGEWPAPPEELGEAGAFLGRLLADPAVEVPAAVVVDVGRIAGAGWAVVEANACWASGLCGCNPLDVLPVLRRASVSQGLISEADRPWLRAIP